MNVDKLNYRIGFNKNSAIIVLKGYNNRFSKILLDFKEKYNANYLLFFTDYDKPNVVLTFVEEDLSLLFKLTYSGEVEKEEWSTESSPIFNFLDVSEVYDKIYFDPSYHLSFRNNSPSFYTSGFFNSSYGKNFINMYKQFIGKISVTDYTKTSITFNHNKSMSVYRVFNRAIYNDISDTILTDVTKCSYGTSEYTKVDYWCKSKDDYQLIEERRQHIPELILKEKARLKNKKERNK